MFRTVSAGVAAAFVKLLLTVGAGVPGCTATAVPSANVLNAGPCVITRFVRARHGADRTVLPIETLRARTGIIVHQILEEIRGEDEVRRSRTLFEYAYFVSLLQSLVFKRPLWSDLTYFAASAVRAGVAVAFVGLGLAVLAGESGLAGAGVAALASVGARSTVLAWLVVGAVVQIWS